jgi:hypothetical protein
MAADFTQIDGTIVDGTEEQAAAATRAALWRIDHRGADPADIRWALEALGLIDPAPVPVVEPVRRERFTPEQDPVTKRWLKRTEETA